jgi:hypothetical protein
VQSRKNQNICTAGAAPISLRFFCAKSLNEMEVRMTLDDARVKARKIANARGMAISLCKLNRYQPNQVVMREHDPRDDEGRWFFIEVIKPEEVRPCE